MTIVASTAMHLNQLAARRNFIKFCHIRRSRDRLDLEAHMASHRERQADVRLVRMHGKLKSVLKPSSLALTRSVRSAPARVHFEVCATEPHAVRSEHHPQRMREIRSGCAPLPTHAPQGSSKVSLHTRSPPLTLAGARRPCIRIRIKSHMCFARGRRAVFERHVLTQLQ